MLVGHSPFSGRSRPANAMVAVSITSHEAGDARDGRDGGWRLPSMPGKKTQLTGTSTAQAQTRRCRCWWSHLGKKAPASGTFHAHLNTSDWPICPVPLVLCGWRAHSLQSYAFHTHSALPTPPFKHPGCHYETLRWTNKPTQNFSGPAKPATAAACQSSSAPLNCQDDPSKAYGEATAAA
ncbi:hypothetical protein CCHR01_18110 [Colletotrichum chrysophilum]|uniref:Uncharacterized protein n=1 Tax=Colletotrichum chrysophilum TaxID=1836956 RepID=A0AAD9A563_9PEZI|nr:hypothetical protein CCHR01_18110 [Colletotrichum chrysophilum]